VYIKPPFGRIRSVGTGELMKLLTLLLLVAVPCLGQIQPTIELGKTSIYIGMPQDTATAALASDGLILNKLGTTSPSGAMYRVSRIGADGTKKDEGTIGFENGAVAFASQIWNETYNTDRTFARALFLLVEKVKQENEKSCTLMTFSAEDTEKDLDYKHITIQCGEKGIDVDLFESHNKDVGSTVSLNEAIRNAPRAMTAP
jgi:hypothetical protein